MYIDKCFWRPHMAAPLSKTRRKKIKNWMVTKEKFTYKEAMRTWSIGRNTVSRLKKEILRDQGIDLYVKKRKNKSENERELKVESEPKSISKAKDKKIQILEKEINKLRNQLDIKDQEISILEGVNEDLLEKINEQEIEKDFSIKKTKKYFKMIEELIYEMNFYKKKYLETHSKMKDFFLMLCLKFMKHKENRNKFISYACAYGMIGKFCQPTII